MKNNSEHYFESLKNRIDYCVKNNIKHMDSNDEYYIAESLVEYSEDEGIGDILTIKRILEINNLATFNKITPPMPIQEYVNKAPQEAMDSIHCNLLLKSNKVGKIQPWLGAQGRSNKNTTKRNYFPNQSIEFLTDWIILAYINDFEKTGDKDQSIRNILPVFEAKAKYPDNPDGKDHKESIRSVLQNVINPYVEAEEEAEAEVKRAEAKAGEAKKAAENTEL